MGWDGLSDQGPERRVIGHSGGQAGTSTQLMILPDQGIVVACMSNTRANDNWGNVMRMVWQLIDLAQQKEDLHSPILQREDIGAPAMDKLVGSYDFGKERVLKIYRKGAQLFTEMNKSKGLRIYPASERKLFYRNSGAWFDFELDENGEVQKTKYVQGGEEYFQERIK